MRPARYIVLALLAAVPLALWLALQGSLPRLDGSVRVAGLDHEVSITRDALGVPTLLAEDREDLAFATGYVHAQDRFFQMDLSRRAAAGRLAELLGAGLLATDERLRIHGFAQVADRVLKSLPAHHRAVLEAYAAGVNAAMRAWHVRPPEYLLLRVRPAQWEPVDSLLVGYAMFLDLNDSTGARELARARLRASLPRDVVDFLEPDGSEWDAPLAGDRLPLPPLPALIQPSLRAQSGETPEMPDGLAVGSNNWAVQGTRTADGRALLANDMHLGLRIPNVWYRARLLVSDAAAPLDLVGVTLPGLPVLISGSNTHVAWGYTNSYGDWTDLVTIEPDPADARRYLTPRGSRRFETRVEEFRVKGNGKSAEVQVKTTLWGPIVGEFEGRPVALAWTAHHPRALNMRHLDLETATSVEQALAIANTIGAPVQNFVAADAAGHIGWTLMGQVPVRAGYDPAVPSSWAAPGTGWVGWRAPDEYPRIIDPLSGRLWTANARTLPRPQVEFMGDGGYDRGARAGQIRDALFAMNRATEADMAQLQLDDRALFLVRWRDLLLDLLDDEATRGSATRVAAREAAAGWTAHAAVDDAGYRVVRAFRLAVANSVYASLTAPARSRYPSTRFEPTPQFEGSLWRLVTERPRALLDPQYATWRAALLAALDRALAELAAECHELARCTWGQHNVLAMTHPIARAVPALSRWLDMAPIELPGDADMPRVQAPAFGASERLVVSPGHEDEGLFAMPGGQSGHFLSPYYRAGHDAWAQGASGPLRPGPAVHELRLAPP